MEDSKCDECQSQNVGFINDDWLCLECGEKMNNKMNKQILNCNRLLKILLQNLYQKKEGNK